MRNLLICNPNFEPQNPLSKATGFATSRGVEEVWVFVQGTRHEQKNEKPLEFVVRCETYFSVLDLHVLVLVELLLANDHCVYEHLLLDLHREGSAVQAIETKLEGDGE